MKAGETFGYHFDSFGYGKEIIMSSVKERFLKYFDFPTVEKYMFQVEDYLTGRNIELKTNAAFINAVK